MSFQKITEANSPYPDLSEKSIKEIISILNNEDKTVASAVTCAIPQISRLAEAVAEKLRGGGRLFYLGAGTSGRLGLLDASEMPPSFGVSDQMVQGIIAGGQKAITSAVEGAEDDAETGWQALQERGVSSNDFVIGISASGETPFVFHALKACREGGIQTGALCNNPESPITSIAHFPVEVITGPEVLTGSTRMKAATAQKMVLNMISTAVMISLGKIAGNKMINLQPLNQKLVWRGIQIIMEELGISNINQARELLEKHGSVKKAIEAYRR